MPSPSVEGPPIIAPDPEPNDEPVDGDALLTDLVAFITRFVVIEEFALVALALWVLHTWNLDAFGLTPYLVISSPVLRCGKSRLMRVLELLCRRALLAAHLTPAVLFRVVAGHRPTLLVDEGDTFLGQSEELRGLLNAGNARNAVVWRAAGPGHAVRAFPAWSAKALAGIGTPSPTITDRAVVIQMARKSPNEKVENAFRPGLEDGEDILALRRRALRWAVDHVADLRTAEPEAPGGLDDRARDNWLPLLSVAERCGGTWPERARAAAVVLSGDRYEDDQARILLLGDLRDLFVARQDSRIATKQILEYLNGLEERPWRAWRGRPLNPEGLATQLRPFGVRPRSLSGTVRGYVLDDRLVDVFGRYLPNGPVIPDGAHQEAPTDDEATK